MQLSGVSRGMGRGVCTVGKFSAVMPGVLSGPRVCRWLVAGAGLVAATRAGCGWLRSFIYIGMPHMERYVAEAAMACDTRDS